MKIRKAVITAASPQQQALPLNMIVDAKGKPQSVLAVSVQEAVSAGADQICVVVQPGSAEQYRSAVGDIGADIRFVEQRTQQGYGSAVYAARDFIGEDPFLHLVADHVFVGDSGRSCASQVVAVAEANNCCVSGVQPTRETQLRYFGAVGGFKIPGESKTYQVNRILEKPTPTEAEQSLMVSGLRTGHYLCFFGIHVFTRNVIDELGRALSSNNGGSVGLSETLAQVALHEKYLATEVAGRRFPLDIQYGLLHAQLALALSGRDRDQVLAGICELLAQSSVSGR